MLVLVQRPQHKSTPDPVAAPKNIPFGTIFIEFGDTKKCCTFSGLELAPKSRKKLIGALSCMHKGPKCIQSLWDHPKKIPFVQKYKESAICAILREETPFWGIPRGKKGVVICAICLCKAAHWPNNNANPSGLSEKKVYCVEHAGPGEGTKLHARKNFCVFYPIELKLCTMIELFIPNNRIVLFFFILTVFGGKMTPLC